MDTRLKITGSRKLRLPAAITGAALVIFGAGTGTGLAIAGSPAPATSPVAATAPAASTPAATETAPDAQQVASSAGATQITPIPPTLYASSEASAMLNGKQVDVVTFTSADLMSSWIKAASAFETVISQGPLWVIAG